MLRGGQSDRVSHFGARRPINLVRLSAQSYELKAFTIPMCHSTFDKDNVWERGYEKFGITYCV